MSKADIYSLAYQDGQAILDVLNPCDIKKVDGKLTCNNVNGLCCGGCKHLSDNGCTTESLTCKLWFCYFGEHYPRELRHHSSANVFLATKMLAYVRKQANDAGLNVMVGRNTKDEHLLKRRHVV